MTIYQGHPLLHREIIGCDRLFQYMKHAVFILEYWKTKKLWLILRHIYLQIKTYVKIFCHNIKKERSQLWRGISSLSPSPHCIFWRPASVVPWWVSGNCLTLLLLELVNRFFISFYFPASSISSVALQISVIWYVATAMGNALPCLPTFSVY